MQKTQNKKKRWGNDNNALLALVFFRSYYPFFKGQDGFRKQLKLRTNLKKIIEWRQP